jgi:predicted ATPase
VSRGDAIDEVVAALRERHTLLVVDNFEQVASGAARLARMLDGCPRLTLVVTSRVRLALADEWVFPVEGLPCPEPEDQDRIESFDAARLFVQAARRVHPELDAAAEGSAIVDICRQVEGLPLALLLAAGWTRVLSCTAIAGELARGTELLRAVDGTQTDRHSSFEVVFDQSWRLLTAPERDALARLSVFRGGFSPEAARAVAGVSLPVLGALADKSLLRKEGSRLQLHPLVQQMAAARLDDQRRDATCRAHAAHFTNLLAQWARAIEEGDVRTLHALDEDYANCSETWRHAVAKGEGEQLARCAPTLHDYFDHRARFEEGLALFREASDAPSPAIGRAFRARALAIVAHLEYRLARFAEAQASARLALAAAAAGDRPARYMANSVLAACAMETDRLTEAAGLYEKALALARASANDRDAASTLENMALVHKRMGHYDESLRLSLEALAQHRRNGDTAAVALCLSNLGSLYMFLGQDATAAAHLVEAQALSERAGLVSTRAFVLANLTELAMRARDDARARSLAERALEVAIAGGIRRLASWLEVQLARLAIRRGDLDAARSRLARGTETALTIGATTLKAALLLAYVELLEAQGERECASLVLALAMEEPSLPAANRDELRQAWEARDLERRDDGRRSSIPLDEVLHRIVIEAEIAHAPLIAALSRSR